MYQAVFGAASVLDYFGFVMDKVVLRQASSMFFGFLLAVSGTDIHLAVTDNTT
jgi:hypothetical protein